MGRGGCTPLYRYRAAMPDHPLFAMKILDGIPKPI
jgi:hypothetical protein